MKGFGAFAFALAGALALSLPAVLAGPKLYPDAIEYLGIAWNWTQGAGLVDPVLYSYYLPGVAPPVPALVMRAPILPALLALPFALGAELRTVLLLHAFVAAFVGALGVFVARRLGGIGAAWAFAIGFCLSFPWIFATQTPLTEALSIGLLVALAALAERAWRDPRAAAGFALLCAVAWLARPNLAVAVPAFALGALLTRGPRGALRSAPLWIAVLGFFALQQGVSIAHRATTGFAPYAHYGVLLETTSAGEAGLYQTRFVGWIAWVGAHADPVRAALAWNAREVLRLLFVLPDYHYVGWLLAPALVDAWRRRDAQRPLRLFLAATGLALLAVVAISWGAIDPRRLLLPAALCFWLLAASWLAHAARRMPDARLAAALPALVVAAAWLLSPSAAGTSRVARQAWATHQRVGPKSVPEQGFTPALCARMDRDAIVASPDPWSVYLACGNAGWVLPRDLDSPDLVARYLAERPIGYVIAPLADAPRFAASPRLERLAAERGHVLFGVRDPLPASRPWRAPPPLAGGGRGPDQTTPSS
ncbi:MAG: hypothetical protein MUF70_00450 [Myxococcota bacterium]|nr:hypothetical protein [Myxococcota bacterium]